MRSRTLFYLSVPLILLALVGLACGASEPVAFSDIPVFPGATPSAPGQNVFGDSLVDAMESAAEGELTTPETQLYIVPAGTAWSDVRSFYETELADTDWEAAAELTQEDPTFSTAGWTRGSGASEQAC
ncbi:MAG: hypothetical protein L0332_19650 [Chloroflexi bacterium]|nr:hypothetical protein [Chloroflexota bacterium]MCI0579822.1 hypothetical protein [Chloroflexota bacterium]MCI0646748.1 hypothetical protein [Chloroflexota bacterium]MCI0728912.1 hypothetical protein [Chloroflexota bacterium]